MGHLAVLAMGSRSCAFGASACELLSRRSVVLWLAPIPLTSHALQPLACEQRAAKGVACSALSRPQAHQDCPTEDSTPDQTHDWWERRSSAPKCTLLLGCSTVRWSRTPRDGAGNWHKCQLPSGLWCRRQAAWPQARCLSFLWSLRQRSLRFRDGGIQVSGGSRTLAWCLWFPAIWSPRTGAGNQRHHAFGPSLLRTPSGVEPAAMVPALPRVCEWEDEAR